MHFITFAAVVAALAFAPAVADGAERLFVKRGVTAAALIADEDTCQLKSVSAKPPPPPKYQEVFAPPYGLVAQAIVETRAQNALDAQARRGAFAKCMKEQGYVLPRLSVADAKAYSRLSSTDRAKWLDQFLSSDRLEIAMARPPQVVPPLPSGTADRWNAGTFRIVPGTLQAQLDQPVTEGGILFSVNATFLGIATLRNDIDVPGGKGKIPAGQVFYQITEPSMIEGEPQTSWCTTAPGQTKPEGSRAICIANEPKGYSLYETKKFPGADIFPQAKIPGMKTQYMEDPIILDVVENHAVVTINFLINSKYIPPASGMVTYEGRTFYVPAGFGMGTFSYLSADIGRDRIFYERDSEQKGKWYKITKIEHDVIPSFVMDYW